jgi:hypothetical protein
MRFSIRDLILVTVIVAILTAWWLDHQRRAAEIGRLKAMPVVPAFSTYHKELPTSQSPAPIPLKP